MKGLAISSFVLAIIGLLGSVVMGVGIVPAILAVIFGFIAISRKEVRGFAIAGIVIGALAIYISISVLQSTVKVVDEVTDGALSRGFKAGMEGKSSKQVAMEEHERAVAKVWKEHLSKQSTRRIAYNEYNLGWRWMVSPKSGSGCGEAGFVSFGLTFGEFLSLLDKAKIPYTFKMDNSSDSTISVFIDLNGKGLTEIELDETSTVQYSSDQGYSIDSLYVRRLGRPGKRVVLFLREEDTIKEWFQELLQMLRDKIDHD